MPSLRDDVFVRIKQIEREFTAVRFAMDDLLHAVQIDPTRLAQDFKVRDLQAASHHPEDTYFIRLFAAFEFALRDFWRAHRRRAKPIRVRDLIDSVGTTLRVPFDRSRSVHEVREYRNALAHDSGQEIKPIRLATARADLCRFLSYLPPQW